MKTQVNTIQHRWSSRIVLLVFAASCMRAADWPMYLYDLAHSSYNAQESAITRDNVATLAPAWTFKSGGAIASGVTVSDGVLYFGNWKGDFFAVSEADGTLLWKANVGMAAEPDLDCTQQAIGVTAQAAVDGDNVYIGGGDSAVYAFNKKTGAQLWRIPLADPASGSYIWSSLMISGRTLYVGVASLGDCPLVRGLLARIDLDSQNVAIRFLYPDSDVGGGIWSTPAIDAKNGLVYFTTGTGEQDVDTGRWGGTMMSVDATTLDTKAHFFLPTNSTDEDIEWGSSPTLFSPADGPPLVAATGKDGVLYVNRADDLTPVWNRKLAVQCIAPEEGCGSLSTPAFDGATLFVGAGVPDLNGFDLGSVYAFDPVSGDQRWMRSLDGTVIAPLTAAGNMVFVPSTTGLNVLDSDTGASLWSDGHHALCYGQAAVVNGSVYVGYINGEVVAWRPTSPATTASRRTPSLRPDSR